MESHKKYSQTRGLRGSKQQKQMLVKYMEKNVNFAQEKYESESGALIQLEKWDELTILLNALDGARKSAEQWKQYWRDLKRNVKLKVVAEKRKLNASGVYEHWSHLSQLNEQEKRIIALLIPNLFDSDGESQEKELDIPESDLNVTEQSPRSETPIKKRKTNQECDDLLVKATTIPESDDEMTIFGKFIISELRSIIAASNQIVYRQAKRNIQQVLMDTWEQIDRTSLSSSPTSDLSDFSSRDCHFTNHTLIEDDSNDDI